MRLRSTDDVSVLAIRISAGRSDRFVADRPVPTARSDQHRSILSPVHEGKCTVAVSSAVSEVRCSIGTFAG